MTSHILFNAIQHNNTNEISSIINHIQSYHELYKLLTTYHNINGYTPLQYAIYLKNIHIVKLLISYTKQFQKPYTTHTDTDTSFTTQVINQFSKPFTLHS